MSFMVVTLEVSKLSGWLNADVDCRELKRGHKVRGEVWGGRREAAGDRAARSVRGRARLQIGGRARGGAHREHDAHVRDAGGVEAQRLVERRRALPRVERRAYGEGRGVRAGRREATGDRAASSVQSRARLQITGARHGGGAHVEHAVHGRDFGGVEAQRLVERRRRLPRVGRRAYGAGRGVGREAGGDGGSRHTQRAGEGATADWGQSRGRSARGTCGTWL
eukprot:scaffold26017_cov39-Phaeocystis_antarctica.AAC.2